VFPSGVILIVCIALFLLYIQAKCRITLGRKFEREYFQAVVNANRLKFPLVRKALERFDAPDHSWVCMALQRDFLKLTYLLRNSAKPQQSYSHGEFLLILYFQAIFFAFRFFKLRKKAAALKLTMVLQYFANVIGQGANGIRFSNVNMSDDALTLLL
jgi:hypothetical protein